MNYSIICLSGKQVADGIMDCLGGPDEQIFCRYDIREHTIYPGYLCLNDKQCLYPLDLCDGHRDCLLGDDEMFCGGRQRVCDFFL